jgi:hypothetical protein
MTTTNQAGSPDGAPASLPGPNPKQNNESNDSNLEGGGGDVDGILNKGTNSQAGGLDGCRATSTGENPNQKNQDIALTPVKAAHTAGDTEEASGGGDGTI